MKKLNFLVIIMLLICLATPAVSFAAWWNPLSWFETETKSEIVAEISTEISSSNLPMIAEIKAAFQWWNPFSWAKNEQKREQELKKELEKTKPAEVESPQIIEEVSEKKEEVTKQAKYETETAHAKAEAEKYKLEAEKTKLEIEKLKKENEAQKQIQNQIQIKKEEDKKARDEELRKQAKIKEVQKQEELRKQVELEKKIAEEYETQRKIEEESAQKEHETQITQKIELDIIHFSQSVNVLKRDIEQAVSTYYTVIDKELDNYLNLTNSITTMPMFKPAIVERHKKIMEGVEMRLSDSREGVWTTCTWIEYLWDDQNNYQEYLYLLENAEKSFKNNINSVINFHVLDLNSYLIKIEQLEQQVNEFSYTLSISNIKHHNNINDLISDLNSLEFKIIDTKNYSISVPSAFSILSEEIDPLLREEKTAFTKLNRTSINCCGNLPTY